MRKMLIVEDHSGIRKLLRMALEFRDFDVIGACDGDEARAMAEMHRPDIVLLDNMTFSTLKLLETIERLERIA